MSLAWNIEKVSSAGEASAYSRVSLSFIQNYRCLAYSSVGASNFVRFARKTGDGWVEETVDTSSDAYARPTVFEYDNVAHVGYVRTDGTTGTLYVARRNTDETWTPQAVYVTANLLTASKFAKKSDGSLAAVTTEFNSVGGNAVLKYHELVGSTWTTITIATVTSEAQEDIDLMFAGDRPYVVYASGVASATAHRMYYRPTTTWAFATVDSVVAIQSAALANVNGVVYVAYSYKSGINYIIRVRAFNGSSFGTTTTLGTSTSSAFGSEIDAASVAKKLFIFARGSDGEGDLYTFESGIVTTDSNFIDGPVHYCSIDNVNGDLFLGFYSDGIWTGTYGSDASCDTDICDEAENAYSPYCQFVDPLADEYLTVHGNKWFYAQSRPGTPWFDKASNSRGWTVDFNVQVHAIENSEGSSDFGDPGAIGIYVNDGKRAESIYFLEQEVVFKHAKQGFAYDTTAPTHYRLTGKDGLLTLYARREGAKAYAKVAEATFAGAGTVEGNASRPSVAQSSLGIVHAAWQDDGDGNGQLFYATYDNGWSEPRLVASNKYGIANPCIVLDADDKPFIFYDTKESAGNSVAMVYLAEGEWSERQYVAVRKASAPKASKDAMGNIYVVYEDRNSGHSEIHYRVWDAGTKSFGEPSVITSTSSDVEQPAITSHLDRIYVSYTKMTSTTGNNRLYARYYSRANGTWSNEVAVSPADSENIAGHDLVCDFSGAVMFVWHDSKDGGYQIYARRYNPTLAAMSAALQLTTGAGDRKYPSISRHATNGRLYLAWEDHRETIATKRQNRVYLGYFTPTTNDWQTSNQGHFDVNIKPAVNRVAFRPALPKYSQGELHIVHEGEALSLYDEYLSDADLFAGIFDTIYTLSDAAVYTPASDEYVDRDIQVSGRVNRKEIRFGSFSNTLSGRVSFKYVKLYLRDAVSPFSIRAIAPELYGLDSMFSTDAVVNNCGDIWFGSLCGGFFYYNADGSLMRANVGGESSAVTAIAFDKNNVLYSALINGDIYKSENHFLHVKVGSVGARVSAMSADSRNRLWIGSANGVYVYETTLTAQSLNIPSGNVSAIAVDSSDVVWIGTDKGLSRYANGRVMSFDARSGMSSSRVNDIAIRNNAIRYIATANGIDKMIGTSFEPIKAADGSLWNDNVKSVAWREPNVLFAGTLSRLNQLLEQEDGSYVTKFFKPNEFSTQIAELDNPEMFYIVSGDDEIEPDATVEVYLNGNRIEHGYVASLIGDNKLVKFETRLLDTDTVDVVIRNDIKLMTSFAQSVEERSQLGRNIIRVKDINVIDSSIYLSTTGDTKAVYYNDAALPYPFDVANVDATPPDGCLTVAEQIDSTTLRLEIELPDGQTKYDAGSGIDKMIISNNPNFTSDGTTPQTPVPFSPSVLHILPPTSGSSSTSLSFSSGVGAKLTYFEETGDVLAATNLPAAIYKLNPATGNWATVKTFGADEYIDFIAYFNSRVYVSVGHASNTAKLYSFTDTNFSGTSTRAVSGNRAYSYAVIGNTMYIGTNDGRVHSFDGTTLTERFDDIGTNVYSLIAVGNNLLAGTGEAGLIYLLNLGDEAAIIRHSDTDAAIVSGAALSSASSTKIFFGTGTEGKIIRTDEDTELYNKSFQTTSAKIHVIRTFGSDVYAAIGDEVYRFGSTSAWTWQYTHSEAISDILVYHDVLYVVSASKVTRIDDSEVSRTIYLKLIDKAGNETDLFDDDGDLVECRFASVSISDLQGFVSENRILEVDELGNTVYSLTGNAPFYSAQRIDQEVGYYESQVLDGTGDLLRWDSMSWTATEPAGTSVKIYVRASNSQNDILAGNWMGPFTTDDLPIVDLDFVNGRYLQFKAELTSETKDVSPTLEQVVVRTVTAESIEFFTTNFALPSDMKQGIFVAQDLLPVEGKIVYGITTADSVNWLDYQEVDPNRLFNVEKLGSNLRVGIRLRSPSRSILLPSDFDEYGPYSTVVFVNIVDFNYTNSGPAADHNFRVTFYEDADLTQKVYEADSGVDAENFSVDGVAMTTGGITLSTLQNASVIFSVPGTASLRCNEFYFVRVVAYTSDSETVILDDRSFVSGCSASFIDNIDFSFTNTGAAADYHFRVRFYEDGERTMLYRTEFSGNNRTGWTVDGVPIPEVGENAGTGVSVDVSYTPDLRQFDPNKVYYLTIDAFDGSTFSLASNSYTFLASDAEELIYCGPYTNVPVVKNFGLIFSLADFKEVHLNK
ncbi:MAG: hypothetical protein HC888_01340 [Candidatus Competibacteraceae bacterium]|nr:hypothetical protein [Candidatus Competibacteraceae bacterium]